MGEVDDPRMLCPPRQPGPKVVIVLTVYRFVPSHHAAPGGSGMAKLAGGYFAERVLRRPHHCGGNTTPTTQKPDLLLQIGHGLDLRGLGASVI